MIAINPTACTGCGTCARVCPHRVIELTGEKGHRKAFLAAEHRCIECGACKVNCHEDAVLVTTGTGCLIGIMAESWRLRRKGAPNATFTTTPNATDCNAGSSQDNRGCG